MAHAQPIYTVENAQVSATFRAIVNLQSRSPTYTSVILELLNYSAPQVLNRANHTLYHGKFDGVSDIISVFTRDDAEDPSYVLSTIRNWPRFPIQPPNLCRSLQEPYTALLAYGCNYATRLAYLSQAFPPPRLTLQMIYLQSPYVGDELVTLLNLHPSFHLLQDLEGPLLRSYSHLRWVDTNIIATRAEVPNVGGGTLFMFMRPDEPLDMGVGQVESLQGEIFQVNIRLSNTIQDRMDRIPNRLRSLAQLKCQEPTITTQDYLDLMHATTPYIVMEHLIVGMKSSCFLPVELEELCLITCRAINYMTSMDLPLPTILGRLRLRNAQEQP